MNKFNLDSMPNLNNNPAVAANANAAFLDMLSGGDPAPVKKEIEQLDLRYLLPYEGQPFKPYTDDRLRELADDIKINGLLYPIIVRKHPEQSGLYQILAGHNRVAACRLLKHEKIPAIVKDVDDVKAQLIMLNTNLNQRHELLPSEKAYAYFQQMEAYTKLGVHPVRTTGEIAENSDDSKRTIQYYLRLARLIPALLDRVDSGEMIIKAGAALSYLSDEDQATLSDFIAKYEIRLSQAQAEQIKELPEVSESALMDLLAKKNKEKKAASHIKIPLNTLSGYFKEDEDEKTILGIIREALEQFYSKSQA